jgi:ABC-2 type transport system permease protein
MTNLLRSEWRKVMSTKLWWGMLIGCIALTALVVVSRIAGATSGPTNGPPGYVAPNPLSDPATQRGIASTAAAAGVFALVVGIILLTTEFRHLTSRPTFLVQPRRGRVIGAKLIVAAAVGVMYAVACAATVVAIMTPWFGARGTAIGWTSNGVLRTLAGAVLAVAISAIVGVGVGVLVRNQIAAVIGALAFLLVVEPLLSVIPYVNDAYRYLPGAASNALVDPGSQGIPGGGLTQLQGGLVFVGWGLLLTLCGWLVTMRRDIP